MSNLMPERRGLTWRTGALASTMLCLLALASFLPGAAHSDSQPLRILVDKTLMAANDWVLTDDHVKQIADAGFTALSPRRGNDDLAEVERVAHLAQAHGLQHLPWMRGTLLVPIDEPGDSGKRLVWADGTQQDLYSPNTDELWDWLGQRVLSYARLSVSAPALRGVLLDFENYAPRSQSDAYALSYDAPILAAFAAANRIDVPPLERDERKRWLDDNGHHDAFSDFQVDRWRQRCRQLRQAVDQINPQFRFGVRPAPGTFFIEHAVWPEWSTPQAPLILLDHTTYGRPSKLIPHDEALVGNERRIEPRPQRVTADSVLYLGGINPIIHGADPEFSAHNAIMLSEVTDGYWVFYEGLESAAEHDEYFRWFTFANQAIAEGRFAAQHEPRTTPDPAATGVVSPQTSKLQLAHYGLKPRMVDMLAEHGLFELHELSGLSADYLGHFDVVLLQNFNVELDANHAWVQALRDFVHSGGGLMLTHDTAWFMASPLPEIAIRDVPTQRVESVRHVVETDLQVVLAHPSLNGLQEEARFATEFRDHMIFRAGPLGRVVIENLFGDPVYVVGEHGQGRIVYSGSYYGFAQDLGRTERQAFLGCLEWLAEE